MTPPNSAADPAIESALKIRASRPGALRRWWDQEWNNFLVALGLRTDWMNPDNAPPAFSALPHKYVDMPDLKCCPKCGGGRLHKIHEVK